MSYQPKFSKAVLSGSQFSDLELFQMFNIDIGAGLVANVREMRHTDRPKAKALAKVARDAKGKMMWHEIPRQKSGVVHNFEAEATINGGTAREAEIQRLKAFYDAMPTADLLSHNELESPINW